MSRPRLLSTNRAQDGPARQLIMAESTHVSATCQVACCHYARRFAEMENLKTFWLTSPISPLHRIASSDKVEYRRRRQIHRHPVRIGEGGVNYVPMTLLPIVDAPLLRSRWALRNSLRLTLPSLRRWLERRGAGHVDVLMISHPHMASLRRIVKYDRFVYRMTDRCVEFPRAPASLTDAEAEMIAHADAVVCTSHVLADALPHSAGSKTTVIPNGADLPFLIRPAGEPDCVREVARPRAVYVGSINAWFDVGWVRAAASALPGVQFVLAGPAYIDLSALDGLPNVHVMGPIDRSLVPGLLQHAEVGIVPFTDTPLVQAVSPIKVYEYLATGLPVVSRSWEELRRLQLPIRLTTSAEEFIAGIREVIENSRPEIAPAISPDNSWDARFVQLRSVCQL